MAKMMVLPIFSPLSTFIPFVISSSSILSMVDVLYTYLKISEFSMLHGWGSPSVSSTSHPASRSSRSMNLRRVSASDILSHDNATGVDGADATCCKSIDATNFSGFGSTKSVAAGRDPTGSRISCTDSFHGSLAQPRYALNLTTNLSKKSGRAFGRACRIVYGEVGIVSGQRSAT